MAINKKSGAPLILAGLAAFAYYKFKKMSPEQKSELKEKGSDFVNKYVPGSIKNIFTRNNVPQSV